MILLHPIRRREKKKEGPTALPPDMITCVSVEEAETPKERLICKKGREPLSAKTLRKRE